MKEKRSLENYMREELLAEAFELVRTLAPEWLRTVMNEAAHGNTAVENLRRSL